MPYTVMIDAREGFVRDYGPDWLRPQPLRAKSKKTVNSRPLPSVTVLHFSAPRMPVLGRASQDNTMRLAEVAFWLLVPRRPGSWRHQPSASSMSNTGSHVSVAGSKRVQIESR